jgi:hypothetical protein
MGECGTVAVKRYMRQLNVYFAQRNGEVEGTKGPPVEDGDIDAPPGPLSLVRVLDFTALVHGPLATQVPGRLGTDVVTIERLGARIGFGYGDFTGHNPGRVFVRSQPEGPLPDANRSGPADPGAIGGPVVGREGDGSTDGLRHQGRRPVHGVTLCDRGTGPFPCTATIPGRLSGSSLAVRIGEFCGANPLLTAQTVPTARAHLYALVRKGLIEAAWPPRTEPGHHVAEEDK